MIRNNKIEDANGQIHSLAVIKEQDGTFSAVVYFGAHYPTTVRRYYYDSRKAARAADIGDQIGKDGRVA